MTVALLLTKKRLDCHAVYTPNSAERKYITWLRIAQQKIEYKEVMSQVSWLDIEHGMNKQEQDVQICIIYNKKKNTPVYENM